jgi:hypothetical protein
MVLPQDVNQFTRSAAPALLPANDNLGLWQTADCHTQQNMLLVLPVMPDQALEPNHDPLHIAPSSGTRGNAFSSGLRKTLS